MSVLDCIRRLDVGGLSSLLADVAPLSDEEEAGPDYPLPSQHWLNTPLGREGEFKTFLQLALETANNDMGQQFYSLTHLIINLIFNSNLYFQFVSY